MKHRCLGLNLRVALLAALGSLWAAPVQAFSLDSTVIVTNFLQNASTGAPIPYTGSIPIDQGPSLVTVGPGLEKPRFGGMWDVDLSDHTVRFTLNSLFRTLATGNDVYQFELETYRGDLPDSKFVVEQVLLGSRSFRFEPIVSLSDDNRLLEVIFPRFFPDNNTPVLSAATGELGLEIRLKPQPVPSPALLPGLLAMGWATLRRSGGDRRR